MSRSRLIRLSLALLIYTLIITQITMAMNDPIIETVTITETEYIEVPVIVYEPIIVESRNPWLRNIPLSEELQEYTYDLCLEYEISYDLFLSLMRTESNFNLDAINKNTNGTIDIGICQINENTKPLAEKLAGRELDLFNPKDNILAAILVFDNYRSQLINKGYTSQEDLFEVTLLAYNRGVVGSENYIASRGTHRSSYVKKVLEYKIKLESGE